ncbi:MAG: alpha/beta hydrolase [Sphingobacteriales bacterium]|jgi:pimeloyl-ACP methyl ester carboxylesterase|nr:alpha/beta hydrolase [Sphingobacteriales bacterium]MBP9141083.1 alpha/beta hydrolase [Chitinophagales bacterium]MDA0198305.1 alpha/beta hydrolase [Bacteroidota bacterium]MBK6890947.1 alpha/beta hydrolase [Sphingobacteriales bacterium]MBK7526004.1 alpha/beta hydrolase [Sphingobacteriales bacterium]
MLLAPPVLLPFEFERTTLLCPTYGQAHNPCVVLLHGLNEDAQIWNTILPTVAQKYYVLTPQLPGYGNTPFLPRKTWSMQWLANWIKALFQALPPATKKPVLAGHSMGGYIAANFAYKHAQHLTGLLFVHSTTLPDTAERRKLRLKSMALIESHGLLPYLQPFFKQFLTPQYAQANPAKLTELTNNAANFNWQAIVGSLNAIRERQNRQNILNNPQLKVGFIMGKLDAFVPYAQNLTEIAQAKSSVYAGLLPNAGHVSMLEAPEALLTHLLTFFDYCFEQIK